MHPKSDDFTQLVRRAFPGFRSNENCKVRTLEDCQNGYPYLAAFVDSDEDFMVYRRFGWMISRILLDKQNELQDLEEQLEESDEEASQKDPSLLSRGELAYDDDDEPPSERKKLLKKIQNAYSEYSDLMQRAQQMMSMGRPSPSAYNSVRNFFKFKAPLCQKDAEWIRCREDLVTLRPGREHAWLDDAVEWLLKVLHCRFIEWAFCSEETKKKSRDKDSVYYTRTRIDRLVASIITIMILALLVIPIYVLYHLTNDGVQGPKNTASCIGVLLVFTLAFSAVLSLFTRARRHEILAAAAAYCAVLVVFLQNVSLEL